MTHGNRASSERSSDHLQGKGSPTGQYRGGALTLCLGREQDGVPERLHANICSTGSKWEHWEVCVQVQGCSLTGSSEMQQEKRCLETFTASFSFHYQSTQSPEETEILKVQCFSLEFGLSFQKEGPGPSDHGDVS